MKLQSAAKINLFLQVEGKRSDGYHDLTSVMQSIALYDTIAIDFEQRDFAIHGTAAMGLPEHNIATRAWRLLKRTYKLPGEIRLHIDKRIPIGAGLAGGSSNGAAVFRAVDRYFDLNMGREAMAALALQIGSDLPFCLYGGTSLVTGSGGEVRPLPPLKDTKIFLVFNDFAVSTAECFAAYDRADRGERRDVAPLITALHEGNRESLIASLYNDLERVTIPAHPTIKRIKINLYELGFVSLMSGSGPTVFALSNDETSTQNLPCKTHTCLTTTTTEAGIIFVDER